MPRPKRKRLIVNPPIMEGFKPFGIPITNLEPLVLLYEEYESIRLTDYQGLTQQEASEKMDVSRPTFTRIYEKARQTIAKAFVEGKAIFIEGGDYHSSDFWYRCEQCYKISISPHLINRCNYCHSGQILHLNQSKHPNNEDIHCICVECNIKMPHQEGVPCRSINCPKCGKSMMREGSYHHQLYLNNKKEE